MSGSGAINNTKLKVYCLEAQPATITGVAIVDTSLGAIKAEAGGL